MSVKNLLFKFPDFFKKKSLDALTNSTTEFPQLDLDELVEQWNVAEIGRQDGEKNIPSASTISHGSNEQKIIASFTGLLTERKNQGIEFIQDLERQFSNMKLSDLVSKLNTFAREAKNSFMNIIQKADDELHTSKAKFESLSKKYKKFKEKNNLEYEAHYPASRILLISILFVEVLIETFFNFSFFKDVSESYIVGGVYNALLLSIVNVVILGWFFGKICFWYKNHIDKSKAIFGWFSFIVFLFLAFLLNYFVANYRVIANLATSQDLVFSFSEVLSNMVTFNQAFELNDWFLFLIGFVAAIIAFFTSYSMDDPYPGYGKIHRQLEEAREEYIEVKNLVEDELDSMKNKQIKDVSNLSEKLTINYNMSKSIINEEENYIKKLKNSYDYLEQACNFCLTKYQEHNEASRSKAKPKYFSKKFKFDKNLILENDVKKNKEILKKTSTYIDQIGVNLTKAKNEIVNNYEIARDRFRVIEQKNKLN